jgi:glycosyltransferase involved in cell wall biosynthesis
LNAEPLVTIGLPVYNGQTYLREAIDCVLAQTHRDFALVISDNASTDDTERICRAYQDSDPRVRYHRHAQNRGASWNFNHCLDVATTRYFKWACYDDRIEPRMLERCVAVLEQEPRAVLAYPRTRIIDSHGETIGLWSDNLDLTSSKPHLRLRQYLRNRSRNEAQYGLWRRANLAMSGKMGSIPYSDQVLMAEMALRGEFREIPEYDFLKRFHEGISTQSHTMYELAGYLDPAKKGKPRLLRLERLQEFSKAVRRVRLGPADAVRCYAELGVLAVNPKNVIRMGQDVVMATRGLLRSRRKGSA